MYILPWRDGYLLPSCLIVMVKLKYCCSGLHLQLWWVGVRDVWWGGQLIESSFWKEKVWDIMMVSFLSSSLSWSSLGFRDCCFMAHWCWLSGKFRCCTVSLYRSDVLWWGFFVWVFEMKEVGKCDWFFCFVFLFWKIRMGRQYYFFLWRISCFVMLT